MKKVNTLFILRIIFSIVFLSVFILLILVFTTFKKEYKPIIKKELPTIKENYTSTTLNEIFKLDGNIYYDRKNNIIKRYPHNNEYVSYYIIGKYNEIYDNQLPINEDNSEIINNHIKTYDFDKRTYIITDENNNVLYSGYKKIEPLYYISNNNIKCDYFYLESDNKKELLNTKNDRITKINVNFDSLITDKYELAKNIYNQEYLTIKKDNKYGLIDYYGNQVIDFIYDGLFYYKDNLYFANKDNKYGLITVNNNKLIEFEHDYITSEGNYLLIIDDNKLNIYNSSYNKISEEEINYEINDKCITNHTCNNNYIVYSNNNTLYLIINDNNYIINDKGISKTFTGKYKTIVNDDNELKYIYKDEIINNKIYAKIYDDNFNEYFVYSTDIINSNYYLYITNIKDEIYSININYYTTPKTTYKTYYIDLKDKKELEEIQAIYNYFNNGYAYTLSRDNILKIYKNNELLSTYENIEKYIGNYYFYVNATEDNLPVCYMYQLEFKKDS